MPWLPKTKIVVPLDFSEAAFAALDVAREMTARPTDLHVVHVLPDLLPLDPSDAAWETTGEEQRIEQATATFRKRLTGEYADIPISIRIGNPAQKIAELAAEEKADLIVLPSHGRTGLNRMLIGSVAERVVRFAHCPVLVLRR